MNRTWVFIFVSVFSLGGSAAARAAADYHCIEEREDSAPASARRLFIWMDHQSNECTVGEQGEGFLPSRIIGQTDCNSDEAQIQIDPSSPRRSKNGTAEYRSKVRLRWDEEGSKPVLKSYIFYCAPG